MAADRAVAPVRNLLPDRCGGRGDFAPLRLLTQIRGIEHSYRARHIHPAILRSAIAAAGFFTGILVCLIQLFRYENRARAAALPRTVVTESKQHALFAVGTGDLPAKERRRSKDDGKYTEDNEWKKAGLSG